MYNFKHFSNKIQKYYKNYSKIIITNPTTIINKIFASGSTLNKYSKDESIKTVFSKSKI